MSLMTKSLFCIFLSSILGTKIYLLRERETETENICLRLSPEFCSEYSIDEIGKQVY